MDADSRFGRSPTTWREGRLSGTPPAAGDWTTPILGPCPVRHHGIMGTLAVGGSGSEVMRVVLGVDASSWTAIGTIALAVVTLVYVLLTGRLLSESRRTAQAAVRSAEAAQRAAELSADALRLEAMPVVTVSIGGSSSGGVHSIKPKLRNSGRSVAVHCTIVVTDSHAQSLEPSVVAEKLEPSDSHTSSITVGKQVYDDILTLKRYRAEVEYFDALGTKYRTILEENAPDRATAIEVERNGEWQRLVGRRLADE